MSRFFNMVGFEYKKIFKRKSSVITLIIVTILIAVSPSLILIGNLYVDGEIYESYYETMVKERDYARALSGRSIDEVLLSEAKEAFSKMPLVAKDEGYAGILEYHKYVRQYNAIYNITYYIYGRDDTTLQNVNEEQMRNFYQIRHHEVTKRINDLDISSKSKDKLTNIDHKVITPFVFSYTGAYDRFFSIMTTTGIFAAFAIAICLAPIFAGEYGTHTDQLILSSRFGKNKLILAKLFTGLSFTGGFCVFMIIITYFACTIIYGFDGGDAPVQLYYPLCIYPMTMWQTVLVISICIVFASIMICAITLFLSSIFKSPFGVIIIISTLLFIPLMLNVSEQNMLIYNIYRLLPSNMMGFNTIMLDLIPYELFGLSALPYIFVPIFYIFVSGLLLSFAYRSFKNHQIA